LGGAAFYEINAAQGQALRADHFHSECWAGLKLVQHILTRIVESGDAPEKVVEKANEFEWYLGTLVQKGIVAPNREDVASLQAVILSGSLPTLRSSQRADSWPRLKLARRGAANGDDIDERARRRVSHARSDDPISSRRETR
jgi:hypothetical protein